MKFSFEESEYLKVIEFKKEHDYLIEKDEQGFPKTGTIVNVECSCGKKIDVTDYGLW